MAFDQATRNRLQKFVSDARKLLSEEFTQQLQNTYGLDPITGTIAALSDLPSLSPSEQQTAKLLRDTLEHYLAASHKADPYADKAIVTAALDRIVREQAFTVLNRLAALRMAEARQFVIESISQGYQSKGFQLYQRIAGRALGEKGQTYQVYLFSVFDELGLDLAVLFDRYSTQGRLFPRETVLLELLDLINHAELELLWGEDETIGWIYQYFNSKEERKKMRDESQAPRNSRELAVRNQFFTPRYVVEFLTDNTLGRIWYEMTKGQTDLVNTCQYLVRRPNEVFLEGDQKAPEVIAPDDVKEPSQEEVLQQTVYIQHRPLKDPRDIKMLDPACGSMHFGLYAFDLFEKIYSEAWDFEETNALDDFVREKSGDEDRKALHQAYDSKEAFLADVPMLIIEHNIHGVDIDPRATQIAGLSLWLRAQKSWADNDIQPNRRPQIQRSNIVCAEPMPGEKAFLKEFTSQIQPRVLGQLVEEIFYKMKMAGEAGTLLKIEEEIQSAIEEAKSQKDKNILEVQGGLFGENKWEVREGKRYYNFGDVDDGFWNQAEHSILTELERYAESVIGVDSSQKRLFAADAVKGFAFIDLCRKRFDIVLMNPPFGECSPKIEKYLDQQYGKPSSRAIYAPFISRASELSHGHGLVGALSARGAYFLSTYDHWRQKMIGNNRINTFIDLGYGVFEGPIVETVCITLSKVISDSSDPSAMFMRLLDVKDRDNMLRDCIKGNKEALKRIFSRGISDFSSIPTSPFAYWYPDNFYNLFKNWKPLKSSLFTACQGMTTTDDFRYMRLRKEVADYTSWPLIAKGGEYATYYSKLDMRVNWEESGRDLHGNKKAVLRNHTYYFKPGITWTEGTTSCFSARYLPEDSAISGSGQGIYSLIGESDGIIFGLLGYLNSRLAHIIIEAMVSSGDFSQAGGVVRHYSTDLIGRVPIPPMDTLFQIIEPTQKLHLIQKKISLLLNYQDSEMLLFLSNENSSIPKYCNNSWLKIANMVAESIELISEIDKIIESESKFQSVWLDQLSGPLLVVDESRCDDVTTVEKLLMLSTSELVEKAFSIYPLRRIKKLGWFINRRLELVSLIAETSIESIISLLHNDKFNPISESEVAYEIIDRMIIDSFLNNISTSGKQSSGESCSLSKIVQTEINQISSKSDQLESEIINKVNVSSLSDVFSKPKKYFEYHYTKNSKNRRYSPLLWPLQVPSCIYTIWIHCHMIDEQTLITCVNDLLDPKSDSILDDIKSLRNKTNRSIEEEKELGELYDFKIELKDFREELVRISQFWTPNIKDGVQISAAPLWKLFQHKPWQKKLKKTWVELEQGKYDWAHMAYNIWPERVLKKCYQDRSIAIAHDVEGDLWEEVEVPAARGRGTKWIWQPKDLTEADLDAYIQQKISKDKSLS